MGLDSQQTLDDKVIERLRQDMGEDASLIIESYVESVDEFLSDISNRTLLTPRADLHRWAHIVSRRRRAPARCDSLQKLSGPG